MEDRRVLAVSLSTFRFRASLLPSVWDMTRARMMAPARYEQGITRALFFVHSEIRNLVPQ
jgi:hypothetical protein